MWNHTEEYYGSSRRLSQVQMGGGQPQNNRIREHRTVLIEKALYLMSTAKRPEGITAELLVRQLEVSDHVFYRLFDSLDDFQNELINTGWKDLLRKLRHVAARTSGREGMDAIIEAYREFVNDNKGSYYLSVCQGRDTAIGRKNMSQLVRLLHIVLASCNLGTIDFDVAARNMADVLQGLAVIEITGEKHGYIDSTVTHLLNIYKQGVFDER